MDKFLLKVRDRRNKGWFFLDNELIDVLGKHIGAIGVALYACLCRHANGEQTCYPSQKLLAKELNISERTVRQYISVLKDSWLIAVDRGRSGKSRIWKNNVYYLLDRTEWWKPP